MWLTAAVGLWLCLACSDPEARPPASGDCNEPYCLDVRSGSAASVTISYLVPEPIGGEAGAAGSSGMPPPLTTLQGSVRMIVEPDLSGSDPPNAPVEIHARGADDTVVVGTPAGDGGFSMAGVVAQGETWVGVGAFNELLGNPFMDTYQAVDSAAGRAVALAVTRRSVMEEIAQTAFLNSPQLLEPRRGHAILSFVDELGAPVDGVTVTFPTPDDASIAYDAGDVYSDALTETSVRGTVVLLNLAAAPYPGSVTSIVATLASQPDRQFRAPLLVSAGMVTLFTLKIDLTP
jgi:hypothetical protein